MTHYVLDVEYPEDEDGEEMPFRRVALVDAEATDWRWSRGVKFDGCPTLPIALRLDPDDEAGSPLADYLIEPLPLMSRRLRAALIAAGVDNVEWFDTRIVDPEPDMAPDHYVAANVVGLVAAADPGATISERPLGVPGADEIDVFAPDPKKIAGLHLFRLAEHLSTLVADETVKATIERHGIDSLRFAPLEGWSS